MTSVLHTYVRLRRDYDAGDALAHVLSTQGALLLDVRARQRSFVLVFTEKKRLAVAGDENYDTFLRIYFVISSLN